jgi:hypothetical protein
MSGGYFDYKQYRISEIADDIERVVKHNDIEFNYNPEIIAKFTEAIKQLRAAQLYARKIDWLLSGDINEDEFLQGLAQDLKYIGRDAKGD